jgi:outer membrane protein assembly factor BamB
MFGAGDGCCYAVDAMTGEKIWRTDIGEGFSGPPLVVGDTMFILSELSNLFAISVVCGTIEWQGAVGHAKGIDNEMAFSDGLLLAGSTGLYAWRSSINN